MLTDVKVRYIDRKVDYHYWNTLAIYLDGIELETSYVIAARSTNRKTRKQGWVTRYKTPLHQGIDGLPEKETLRGDVTIIATKEVDD